MNYQDIIEKEMEKIDEYWEEVFQDLSFQDYEDEDDDDYDDYEDSDD